jgi:hypothetical protein
MNVLLSTTGISIYVLCGLPIFVILCMTIATALRQGSTFGKNAGVVIALCVSLLCVLGLYRMLVPAAGGGGPLGVDPILWPYTALGIAVLLLLFLMFLGKLARSDKRNHFPGDVFRQMAFSYPRKDRKGRAALRSRPKERRGDTDREIRSVAGRRTRTRF